VVNRHERSAGRRERPGDEGAAEQHRAVEGGCRDEYGKQREYVRRWLPWEPACRPGPVRADRVAVQGDGEKDDLRRADERYNRDETGAPQPAPVARMIRDQARDENGDAAGEWDAVAALPPQPHVAHL